MNNNNNNIYNPNAVKATLDTFGGGLPVAIFLQKCKVVPKIGFFDDYEKAAVLLQQYDGTANVFFSLNKISNEKLRRVKLNPDDLAVAQSGDSLTNADISDIRWFFIDIDPVRAQGHEKDSASEAERKETISQSEKVREWLVNEKGWPDPIMCSSGNGVHLLFKIDMPNTQENTTLIKNAIESISKKFPQVDASVASASRYAKLYGTLAVKGVNTSDRPHRRSEIMCSPEKLDTLTIADIQSICCSTLSPSQQSMGFTMNGKDKNDDLEVFYNDICQQFEPFIGSNDSQSYVTIYGKSGGIFSTYKLHGAKVVAFMQQLYKDKRGEIVHGRCFERFIDDLSNRTLVLNGISYPVFTRIGQSKRKVFYDLGFDNKVIVIESGEFNIVSWREISDRDIKMIQSIIAAPQVEPQIVPNGKSLADLLYPFLNVDDEDKVLILITILYWMIAPSLPKPILSFYGPQGSGKSTITRFIQRIVDPVHTQPATLSKETRDIVATLGSSYLVAYDNLSDISREVSNLFCQVSTGGSSIRRALYTDSDVCVTSFNNALILNGLSGSFGEIDLRDRMVRVQLHSIKNSKPISQLEGAFKNALPEILGQIFLIISQVEKVLPNIQLEHPSRLSDYEQYGAAFSQIIFGDKDIFLNAFHQNRKDTETNFVSEDALCSIVGEILKSRMGKDSLACKFEFVPNELYGRVTRTAASRGLKTSTQREWPQSTAKFTAALTARSDNFSEMGFMFDSVKTNGKRLYRFTKLVNEPHKESPLNELLK